MKTLEAISRDNFDDWANTHDDIYIESSQLRFHQYRDNLSVIKIANAMERGKTCIGYSLRLVDRFTDFCATNAIQTNINDLVALLDGITFEETKYGYLTDVKIEINGINFSVSKYAHEAIRTFSPFSKSKLKPLDKKPTKWTLSHLYRALANNQLSDIKCTGHYTDDYAYDASVNCEVGKGVIAEALLEDILESPSGWRVYEMNDKVSIHCHSFLGYEAKFIN